jgi:hypothetical protein
MLVPDFILSSRATVWMRCAALALVIVSAAALVGMIQQTQPGLPFGVFYVPEKNAWSAQDFSSHFQFSRHLWLNDLTHPYTVAGHNAMMSAWIGRPIEGALPYGYTPTFALVLLPLLPLPPVTAYGLWVLLPALMMCFLIWKWAGASDPALRLWAVLFLVAGFSATFIRSAQLGQTAIWSALMLLALFFRKKNPARPLPSDLLTGFLLFLLSAKPPLAVTASLALWWSGERRPIGYALGLTALWIALVTLWLGVGWIPDYVTLLSHYNLNDAPSALATSLEPNRMSNLRNFLYGFNDWNDSLCARVSGLAWLLGCAFGAVLFWKKRLAVPTALALSLAIYEAFCPHLTYTEDLLTTGIIGFLALSSPWRISRLVLALGLFWILNAGPGKLLLETPLGAQSVFLLKLGLLAAVAQAAWKQRLDLIPSATLL